MEMMQHTHPMLLLAQGVERAPLRRPRFTATEVLILNELINQSPNPVGVSDLARMLQRYSTRFYPVYQSAVRQHIVNLRAKLGEASRQPTLIISTYVEDASGTLEIAYQYREPR